MDNHLEELIGRDLGDGTKLVHGRACFDATIRDPPGEEFVTIEVETPRDTPSNGAWKYFALGAMATAFIATSAILVSLAVRKRDHVCDWANVIGADSWVRVCVICGRYGNSLNDQSARIHLTPVNS